MADGVKYFIACDFDGTVTEEDTLDLLVEHFAPGVWEIAEAGLKAGTLTLNQAMIDEFRNVRVSERDAVEYVLRTAELRAGFEEFVRWAAEAGHELVIVSAGFRVLIDAVLARAGRAHLHVHAGDALFTTQGTTFWFPPSSADCIEECGHCKRDTIAAHAPFPGPLVYIGDGYSDRCPAQAADIVFARRSLAEHLDREGVPYHHFEDFHSVVRVLDEEWAGSSAADATATATTAVDATDAPLAESSGTPLPTATDALPAGFAGSTEPLAELFNTSKAVMGLVDPTTARIIDANEAACAMYGYSREEFRGMPVSRLNDLPEDTWRDQVEGGWEGPDIARRFRNRLASGEVREVETHYTHIHRGGRRLLLGITRDVTHSIRAREALEESEARFRLLAENSPDVIFSFRLTEPRGFTYMSPAVTGILEASPEEFYADPGLMFSMLHPGDEAPIEAMVRRNLPEAAAIEIRLHTPSGRLVWAELSSALRRDAAGIPVAIEGVARDITARKRQEEERAFLLSAVEQMDEVVVITDTDATIVYVNPAFERVTGYSQKEAMGRNPRFLSSGREEIEFYQELWATILAGRVWTGRFTNRRADGRTYEEEASISPVRDAEGHIVNYVAVKRDITRELALEGQLMQSQKMEAVGRLAGGVAHDFNNLLTSISGYADLLAAEISPDDPIHLDVVEIQNAADRAADLTRRLLAFSRKEVVRPRPVDMVVAVSGMSTLLRRMVGPRVELVTELVPAPLVVLADPSQVEQVLMNLAVNASDAMPDGGVLYIGVSKVTSSERCPADGVSAPAGCVRLSVRDTGVGMEEEVAGRVFEPFFTTKDSGRGTGLGLATVYGIVEAAGGSVSARSVPGEGSEFEVFLPLYEGLPSDGVRSGVRERRIPRGRETVLVVDDELPVLRLAARTLTGVGYTVIEATDAETALAIVDREGDRIDLVVTDVAMPRMTGTRLAELLSLRRPGLKVVFVSGYAGVGDESPDYVGRVAWFLQKPFGADDLAQIVREALDS
ncbi:MAG: MtnX-like HAD-IB family phosphatase [Actinobacteria bacterium]|nr:MtnX-like HAD-IB family phosphatase [Actinomycetota bacterium]